MVSVDVRRPEVLVGAAEAHRERGLSPSGGQGEGGVIVYAICLQGASNSILWLNCAVKKRLDFGRREYPVPDANIVDETFKPVITIY